MRYRTILVTAISIFTASLCAAQNWDEVEITAHHVRGNVYMLEGYGGNIGVSVGDDGVVLVDDQFAPLVPKIREALRGITNQPVRFILNTHWHGDHTGGNEILGASAPVIAHDNVRKRMTEGLDVPDHIVDPSPEAALPVLTFDQRLTIHLNGERVRAIHFPHGHTDGDVVVFFTGSDVVHMGDDFFSGLFPYVDLDSGGSVHGLIQNVKAVLAEIGNDTKIIPGHGPISSPHDLRAYLTMLEETSAVIRRNLDAGRTAEQMIEDHVLEKWEHLSWSFIPTERYIRQLVRDFTDTTHHPPTQ